MNCLTMIPLLILTLILLAAFVVLLLLPALSGQPWVPASENRIHRALEMAELKPGEVLYDLGSGDGRVLIAAARDFGARAVGVELSPLLCPWPGSRSRYAGVPNPAPICAAAPISMPI